MKRQSVRTILNQTPPQIPAAPREANNGKTGKEQKTITTQRQVDIQQGTPDQAEEKATIEISLYLKPSQDEKLEDLRRAYKKRMERKISSNQVMRKLIDKATIDDLF